MDRVTGPTLGFYIASYACVMGDLGDQYLGLAKLCTIRPSDYWQAKAIAEIFGTRLLRTPEEALEDVEGLANAHILGLTLNG